MSKTDFIQIEVTSLYVDFLQLLKPLYINCSVLNISIFPFTDPLQKDEINKKAFEKFKKEHTSLPSEDKAVPSERFDGECYKVCRLGSFLNKRAKFEQQILSKFQLLVAISTLLPGPQRNKNC